MRIVQFRKNNDETVRIGVMTPNNKVVDATAGNLVDFLQHDDALLYLESLTIRGTKFYSLADIELLAPITKPDKVLCIGLNYKEHCDESKVPYPEEPVVFSKFSSTIVGPFDDIVKPACTSALDWEVELVVVIGKIAKNVTKEKAFDYILGYTIAQDITARDWNWRKNGGQYLLAKSMDTFCPLGPCIVTKDEIADPHQLKLKCWVNGELKQSGSSSELVHRIDALVAHISKVMTLYPGDIILTGTPSGVGFSRNPPEALKAGDLVESEIDGIGKMANHVAKAFY